MTSGELARNTLLTKLRKIAYDAETGAVKKNIVAKTIDFVLTKALNKQWLKLFLLMSKWQKSGLTRSSRCSKKWKITAKPEGHA